MQYVMRVLWRRTEWNALTITASVAAFLIAVPVVVVLGNVFLPAGDTWEHLARTVLPEYISNTLWLMLGVGAGVTVVGVATA
jgi:iron(III) transport system permease protein